MSINQNTHSILNSENRKRRTAIEITADILDAANNGATKTKIMQLANLSYKLLCKYLTLLTRQGFIENRNDTGPYHITSKGHKFLKEFKELQVLQSAYSQKRLTLKEFIDHEF